MDMLVRLHRPKEVRKTLYPEKDVTSFSASREASTGEF